jgi:quercetin dioxygenase-like cupin family protein
MKILAFLLLLLPAAAFAQAEGYSSKITATPLLRTSTTSADQQIVYPKVEQPEVTALMVEIPPGAETGWHKHPYPAYAYLLSGELDVELEGGKVNHYKAGEAVAETVNMLHNGKNNGTVPVKLVMFVTGEKGQPFTVKAAK